MHAVSRDESLELVHFKAKTKLNASVAIAYLPNYLAS